MRKSCKRRHLDLARNPVRLALIEHQPVNGAWLLGLRIAERAAVQALIAGTANRENALTLRRMIETALKLARDGIGPELLPLAQRCLALKIGCLGGVYRLGDPAAADDLAELVELADMQRDLTDRGTFERARGHPV